MRCAGVSVLFPLSDPPVAAVVAGPALTALREPHACSVGSAAAVFQACSETVAELAEAAAEEEEEEEELWQSPWRQTACM